MLANTNHTMVTILSFDGKGNATCQTQHGGHITVTLGLRNGKGAWPQIGETWVISQEYGQWMFAAQVNKQGPLQLFIDRTDPADAALKVVDALVKLGLANEIDLTPPYILGDTPLPKPSLDGDGYSVASGEEIGVPMWMGTYNTGGSTRTNALLLRDIVQMLKSPLDVFGLQEMYNGGSPGFRDQIVTYLNANGYNVIRYETGDSSEWNWIVYNASKMAARDSGIQLLTESVSGTNQIARYAIWANFEHAASGQRFTFINTHLVPYGRYASHFYTDQVSGVASLVQSLEGWGPIYVAGDLNLNYFSGTYSATGNPGSSVWTSLPLVSAYSHLSASTGTVGTTYPDAILQGPDPGGLGTLTSMRVLTGFFSGHRPLLVQAVLKRKDSDMLV